MRLNERSICHYYHIAKSAAASCVSFIKVCRHFYFALNSTCSSPASRFVCGPKGHEGRKSYISLSYWWGLKRNNGPSPSCPKPLFQSEAKCEAIDTKMIFILMQIKLIFTFFESESFWNPGNGVAICQQVLLKSYYKPRFNVWGPDTRGLRINS